MVNPVSFAILFVKPHLTLGALELNTHFKNLIMYGCGPTDTIFTGGWTDDYIDLSPYGPILKTLVYRSE